MSARQQAGDPRPQPTHPGPGGPPRGDVPDVAGQAAAVGLGTDTITRRRVLAGLGAVAASASIASVANAQAGGAAAGPGGGPPSGTDSFP